MLFQQCKSRIGVCYRIEVCYITCSETSQIRRIVDDEAARKSGLTELLPEQQKTKSEKQAAQQHTLLMLPWTPRPPFWRPNAQPRRW